MSDQRFFKVYCVLSSRQNVCKLNINVRNDAKTYFLIHFLLNNSHSSQSQWDTDLFCVFISSIPALCKINYCIDEIFCFSFCLYIISNDFIAFIMTFYFIRIDKTSSWYISCIWIGILITVSSLMIADRKATANWVYWLLCGWHYKGIDQPPFPFCWLYLVYLCQLDPGIALNLIA